SPRARRSDCPRRRPVPESTCYGPGPAEIAPLLGYTEGEVAAVPATTGRSVAAGVSFDQAVSSSGRSRGSRAKSQTSRQTFRPCRSRPQRSVARLDSEDGNFEESSWGSEIPVRA